MRIRSPLINRLIDKADNAFTWASRILPPDKPVGRLRIGRHRITQLDIAIAVLTIIMGIGFWWWYGHWSMFAATLLVTVMLWLWLF